MHTAPMPDSAGEFQKGTHVDGLKCKTCDTETMVVEPWESNCGGYEDYKYTCTTCGRGFWVDGVDS